ncbi:MAG TPA: rod shape-determining protein RodA [Bacillota bacterium]|mgnify:CR=1 FL=1|nr:rod shape-determining protein RodA [Bacillota bacterium]
MILDRRLLRNLDFPLITAVLVMCGIGFVVVYSATHGGVGHGQPKDSFAYLKRQLVAFLVGVACIIIILTIDYNLVRRAHHFLYWGNIAILLLVLLVGKRVSGAERWLKIGPLVVQPSEMAKIVVILTLSNYLADADMNSRRDLIIAFLHVGLPTGLVLLQNDLGTAIVFAGITIAILFVAGMRPKDLLAILAIGALASPIVFFLGLKDYQRARILTFINPYADPTGTGYNVIQSTIAIGSGGFFGKGLFKSTQVRLNFLPAHHTDFIFSVIGEELGFLGGVAVLALYAVILWRCLRAASSAKDSFGQLVAAGVASMILIHVVINIGMTMSLMPVTGIPLPFLSYGGSSLMANLVAIGFVLNINMRRQKILF